MEIVILVRYGEIFLKKGNRGKFLSILRRNLTSALKRVPGLEHLTVSSFHGRYQVEPAGGKITDGQMCRAVEALATTFGVVSVSPAVKVEPTVQAIEDSAAALATRELEKRTIGTFKVQTSRSWKRFPMKSPDLSGKVGARIVEEHKLPVRMKDPDLTVGIEIHEHDAYVFAGSTKGPGGLPIGSSGSGVLLLSGGIDSPVAGWMMAKRGCRQTAVHFHSYPYTSRKSVQKVEELADSLSRWMGPIRLISIKLAAIQEYLRNNVPDDKLVLFYRRSMVRLATRVAKQRKALALVTGESLGQVASQTLENLGVIEDSTDLTILRPLVGMDKSETVDLARRIGTFEISIKPHDDCCSLFLPPHPETRGKVPVIVKLEKELEQLADLENTAFDEREEAWRPVQ